MGTSDNSRPPGGTSRGGASRTPGTRTPRKVQWPDTDTSPFDIAETPLHMLDEQGIDRERFRALTEALEQHRKLTPLKKVHCYLPLESEEIELVSMAECSEEKNGTQEKTEEDNEEVRGEDVEEESRDIDTHPSSAANSTFSLTPAPSHSIPGNLISEDEDAGLPGTTELRKYSIAKADHVVRKHLKRCKSRLSSRLKKKPHSPTFTNPEKDVEGEADQQLPHGGTGILSTLLNLYQLSESDYHSDSGASSYPSSCGSPYDYDYWSDSTTEHIGLTSPLERRRAAKKERVEQEKAERKAEMQERVYNHKTWSFSMPSIFGYVSRPAAARNAGGVFGPLIASTGNLAGVAAPHANTLQPNVKRPGYHLSRYSLETKSVQKPRPAMTRGMSANAIRTIPPSTSTEPGLAEPSHAQDSFYHHSSKGNLSSIFGGYVNSIRSGRRSGYSTPTDRNGRPTLQYGGDHHRHKRRKAEVFITRHVAQIIQREEFLIKLTRAMIMFGGPSHRLQSMIQSAARVLDVEISIMYLPDIVFLSFDDSGTGTSHIKIIRQSSVLDLGKLDDAFSLYWKVIHDKLLVSKASVELDALMKKKPMYGWAMSVLIGGMCSAAICTVSFGGSFVDALVSFPLGSLLVAIQMIGVRNVLYTNVFEVTIATLFSFIAAALATTHKICYSAVTSSSVVLILPGFLVLTGSLELMSRHIVAGSVRICFAVVYALFLGFGFTIGAGLLELITSHKAYGADDYTCSLTHDPSGPWYQQTPSIWWAFLTVPLYSTCLSMRNQAPWNRKELPLLVSIASAGWVTNYFTGRRFVGQSDIIAAVGAFAVGLISNLYSRIFSGNAFVVMITGIMFQLPSGLGSGGLLSYASQEASGNTMSYLSEFRTALKLISVAIGLTIGLGLSLFITHPVQSRKREAGIFSL